MHISVNSQYFAQELRLLNKVAPVKAPLPILSHMLLRASDTLQMYATDLEVGLRTTCPATVLVPGQVALPVATLLSMVEQFPKADIIIAADKQQAHITCGAFTSRLQTQPLTDFPAIPEMNGNVRSPLHARNFAQIINRVRYAVPEAATQFLLRGALLALTDTAAAMVATDGRRLALATMPREGESVRATIPSRMLDLVLAQPELTDTSFIVGERHLFFQIGQRLLISRMLEGEFPKFERIIPQEMDKKAVVNRMGLAAALKRVGLVSGDDKSARLRFSEDGLEITSSSAEVGDAGEKVPMTYTGDPLEVCCNWQFVVEFLDAAVSQTIAIELKDGKTPLLLTEGDNHLAVIMLIQG
jgi:DNA polymerase-3 subunit beta